MVKCVDGVDDFLLFSGGNVFWVRNIKYWIVGRVEFDFLMVIW